MSNLENEELGIYLNDHLAGSVGALELLDRLVKVYEAQSRASFCQELRDEIAADQQELRDVMKALGIEENSLLKAGAWAAEKFSRAKLGLEDGETGSIGLVQALEGLTLGIKGKEVLWRALAAVQRDWPSAKHFDFVRLEKRAIAQGARVDEKRIQAACEAFRPQVKDGQ